MQKSCLEYIMTSVINSCASSHSQKPGAPDRDPKSWGCRGLRSVPAILFVFFLFSPDTALKVWHRFPAAGTVLEVLYHSRLPRGQQSSPSRLSRLYRGVTLEEVSKGVIRGQEKAQCRSSRMPGEEKSVCRVWSWMQSTRLYDDVCWQWWTHLRAGCTPIKAFLDI